MPVIATLQSGSPPYSHCSAIDVEVTNEDLETLEFVVGVAPRTEDERIGGFARVKPSTQRGLRVCGCSTD